MPLTRPFRRRHPPRRIRLPQRPAIVRRVRHPRQDQLPRVAQSRSRIPRNARNPRSTA